MIENIIPIGEEDKHRPKDDIWGHHCKCCPSVVYNESGVLVCVHNSLIPVSDITEEEVNIWYEEFKKKHAEELELFGAESWIINEWANAYSNEKISSGKFRELVRELLTSKFKYGKR